jgi:hypothetical protein
LLYCHSIVGLLSLHPSPLTPQKEMAEEVKGTQEDKNEVGKTSMTPEGRGVTVEGSVEGSVEKTVVAE